MIQIQNLSLARGAKPILQNASVTLYPKEKVGLIGHNGAGKSSLISAILHHIPVDQGSIDVPASWTIATIEQEVPNTEEPVIEFALQGDPELHTIRSTIRQLEESGETDELGHWYERLENVDGYRAESRVASILHGLGFSAKDLSQPVKQFSGGWKMRMNLARVLGSRADFILLDEPTNHLDIDAVIWLEQWIRQVDATVLVVSHDRDFLDTVCTHTVHLNDLKLNKTTGGYTAFERAFAERTAQIEQANRKSQAEAAHLQKFIERFKAKASKAKQAQSRVKRLERIQMIETMKVDKAAELRFLEPQKAPDPLVVLNKVDCGYGPDARVLQRVSLEIRPGDRIGLLGANGNGKTTLVKTLVGQLPALEGERTEGKGLVCGYFAQNAIEALDWESTPLEHFKRLDKQATEQHLRGFLAQYHFGEDKIHQAVGSFSGGEKSRLALALIAYTRPNLLLLDEPTNHLDIGSRQSLATGLLDFEGALVVVSHDRHLLESITDQFLWVHDGSVQEFAGDLDDYSVALKQAERAAESRQTVSTVQTTSPTTQKTESSAPALTKEARQQAHQQLKKLRNQQKKLENELELLQSKLKKLDADFASLNYGQPDSASLAQQLSTDRESATERLQCAEEELLDTLLEIEGLEALGLN